MPLPPVPGQPTTAPSTGPVGASSPSGAPPMGGAGGATMPTQNRGSQAAALSKVQAAVRALESALPELGATSEAGQAVMKAIMNLAKHIPAGSTSPGVDNAALQKMMMQGKQDQPQMALMRALGQQGAGAPPGGAQAPGAAA